MAEFTDVCMHHHARINALTQQLLKEWLASYWHTQFDLFGCWTYKKTIQGPFMSMAEKGLNQCEKALYVKSLLSLVKAFLSHW